MSRQTYNYRTRENDIRSLGSRSAPDTRLRENKTKQNKTSHLNRSITLRGTDRRQVAALECVIPVVRPINIRQGQVGPERPPDPHLAKWEMGKA